jgi:tripartite-type tricarboxylate transporter receptor subunit TctC
MSPEDGMLRPIVSALFGFFLALGPAAAQSDYPSRPVKILVPSSPGGGTDILARVLADHLGRALKGQFYVENRPGAGQMIGIEVVAHSPNDGYTLLMAASTLSINPVLFKAVRYDALKDFAPISLVASLSNVFVCAPDIPFKSIAELVAAAKQKPFELTYASAGIGTSPHMSAELLMSMTGSKLTHVPFRGTGPMVTEVLSGRVTVGVPNMLTAKPHLDAGTLRALAVTGNKRTPALPDVPTVAEAGVPGYESIQWYGLLAPAGTPPEIVTKLHEEVSRALAIDTVQQKLRAAGVEPKIGAPDEVKALLEAKIHQWSDVIKSAGIKIDER